MIEKPSAIYPTECPLCLGYINPKARITSQMYSAFMQLYIESLRRETHLNPKEGSPDG